GPHDGDSLRVRPEADVLVPSRIRAVQVVDAVAGGPRAGLVLRAAAFDGGRVDGEADVVSVALPTPEHHRVGWGLHHRCGEVREEAVHRQAEPGRVGGQRVTGNDDVGRPLDLDVPVLRVRVRRVRIGLRCGLHDLGNGVIARGDGV